MIFQTVQSDEPIRQGDVFVNLPRCDISLAQLFVLKPSATDSFQAHRQSWQQALNESGSGVGAINASVSIVPVNAIVVSQDCDVARSESISFCEIVQLTDVLEEAKKFTEPKHWASFVKRHSDNPKWLYLPAWRENGLKERSAIDFCSVFQLSAIDASSIIDCRVGRLNEYAFQHFREKVANFFRRYAVDRWYSLTKEELAAYTASLKGEEAAPPFDWQK